MSYNALHLYVTYYNVLVAEERVHIWVSQKSFQSETHFHDLLGPFTKLLSALLQYGS